MSTSSTGGSRKISWQKLDEIISKISRKMINFGKGLIVRNSIVRISGF